MGPVVDWVSDKIRGSLTVSLMMNCYFIPNILLLQMPRGEEITEEESSFLH